MSGKLFQDTIYKAEPIRAEIAPTIQKEIIDKLINKFPNIKCIGLGSVGKKKAGDYNGDIDIGVVTDSIDELSNIISKSFLNADIVTYKTIYIVSIKYEYKDNDQTKYVAVDFIHIKNIEYAKFRYYCPDYRKNESKYKVGTKIMFVGTILNHCEEKNKDIPNSCYGKYNFSPVGLFKYVIDKQDIRKYKEYFITDNIDDIVHIIFNEKGSKEDFNSVETLWDALHSDKFKYPKELRNIECAFFANSYRKGWEELVDYRDFKLSFLSKLKIKQRIKKETYIRNINNFILKMHN